MAYSRLIKLCWVSMEDFKTLNDFKLLQISWVFDLNYTPFFKAAENRKYLDQIEATLPKSKEIADAVGKVHDFVKSHAVS